MKGHQAPDGTRRIINMINHVENSRTPSLRFALDAEKAFVKVHWDYTSQTLMTFVFSGFIQEAIMSLYTQPSAKVFTSAILSKDFKLTNGTRQGFPLSPYNLISSDRTISGNFKIK